MSLGEDTVKDSSTQLRSTALLPQEVAAYDPARPLTVISPHRGWFDWRLGQLWQYRDLIAMFVWRDFVAVYKQTILGPLWHIVRPLITTIIFTVVFSRMAGLSTDGAPPFLFYMVGNVVWTYFATSLDNTSRTFVGNVGLMGKVYFHRLVIPISVVFSNLIAFGIQFSILLVVMLFYRLNGTALHTGWMILAMPLILVVLAGYALGVGVIICALTTRYRDLSYLVMFGIQLLMYLSPVIYPVSSVPANYRWAINLNPLTPLFEASRFAMLGVGTISLMGVIASVIGMVVVLAFGIALFTRVERTFLDTV